MARPIEYNKEEVLTNAMKVFWHKGYESTSMKDLVEATGMTTRSMYNIFGSKNGLFKACLEWYHNIGSKLRIEKLNNEDGLAAIRHFIEYIVENGSDNGCLYVNTVSDRNNIDNESLNIVDDYFENLENSFESKLLYAKEHEGFIGDPKLRAKQLVLLLQGLSVHSKKDRNSNVQMIEDFLSLMNI